MDVPRLALIDSGLNPRHPHVAALERVEWGDVGAGSPIDVLGHGTCVAAAIVERASHVELLSIKIFDASLTCPIERVSAALATALSWRPDVVNLSFGTTSAIAGGELAPAVRALLDAGVRVVAPAFSRSLPAYPGLQEGVDGVVADRSVERGRVQVFRDGGRSLWLASPYPRGLEGLDRHRNLKGESLATAAVTAAILKGELPALAQATA